MEPMGSPLNPQQPLPPPAHTRAPVKALVVLLVILVGAGVLAGVFFAGKFVLPMNTTQGSVTLPGLLVMTIETKSVSGLPARAIPVQYAPTLKDFLVPPVDQLVTAVVGGKAAYQHRLSDNLGWITFVGAVGLDGSAGSLSELPLQVYRANTSKATYDTITSVLQRAQSITTDSMYKQFPVVSDAGDVLYMGRSAGVSGKTNANSWGIYLVPAEGGAPRLLTNGVSPQWIDDNNFIFMADDGLKVFHVTVGYAEKVWGITSTASDNVTINVSRDKKFIAVSFPDSGETFVFRSLNGTMVSLTLRGSIVAPGSYAVISPDNKFIAMQTYNPSTNAVAAVLAVDFFDLETLQVIPSVTIDILKAYPNIQASALSHALKGMDRTNPIGGLVDVSQPASVVLTDWIP